MQGRKRSARATALVAALLLLVLAATLWASRESTRALSYADFEARLSVGDITRVTLNDGDTLQAVDRSGQTLSFPNPRLDTFKHTLLAQGVTVEESGGGMGWLALLPLAAVMGLLWGRQGKARGFALENAATAESEIPSVTFQSVAANEEALTSLRDLVGFIRDPAQYARYGARAPRGVLLYGPPGTGKTLMARALAGEARVPFYAVNGADFVEMYVGVGAARIRKLFAQARKAGRAVIFIDEIDALGSRRDQQSDEREQTLNALLSEMSGFRDGDGVIVLGATNRIEALDEALLRAGRFDRQIEAPLPGYEERLKILAVHAQGKPLAPDVSLSGLAAQTALFSGARLESVLNEAAILAAKRDDGPITAEDVNVAYETMLCGAERRDVGGSYAERRLTAAHEAGHAIGTLVLLPDQRLRKVSIIPSTKGAAGYSLSIQPERLFHSRRELLGHIAVALAGRAAEELSFGRDATTTGAANDLEKAAELARRMVCEWGMYPDGTTLYAFRQAQREGAAQQWVQTGYQLALRVLATHRPAWERLTELLLRREAVGEEDVHACLREASAL